MLATDLQTIAAWAQIAAAVVVVAAAFAALAASASSRSAKAAQQQSRAMLRASDLQRLEEIRGCLEPSKLAGRDGQGELGRGIVRNLRPNLPLTADVVHRDAEPEPAIAEVDAELASIRHWIEHGDE